MSEELRNAVAESYKLGGVSQASTSVAIIMENETSPASRLVGQFGTQLVQFLPPRFGASILPKVLKVDQLRPLLRNKEAVSVHIPVDKPQVVELPESGFADAQIPDGSRASLYFLQQKSHDASILVEMREEARGQSATFLEQLVCSGFLPDARQLPFETSYFGDHGSCLRRRESGRVRDDFGGHDRELFCPL